MYWVKKKRNADQNDGEAVVLLFPVLTTNA